mmetsp:Transcript_23813/g.39169  ORF Transcript_23813/g.39169 Transcript_23813/m.39169 type:complete len:273 (-) Transcript_23813:540-1358(-)
MGYDGADFLEELTNSPVMSCLGLGQCVLRLLQYNEDQRRRPKDNNIEFWRRFMAEYFSEKAKMKVDVWNAEYGEVRCFEPCAEVLPRLFKTKFDSGIKEELVYMENPCEYLLHNGAVVMDCPRAVLVSVFDNAQVCNYGHLRVSFTDNLKIVCWEFCTRAHEEMLPRPLLQQKRSLSGNVEVLLPPSPVNEFGLTPQYVRCLQIADVVHDMKDLMTYTSQSGTGPLEAYATVSRQLRQKNSPFSAEPPSPQVTSSSEEASAMKRRRIGISDT